ncbi:Flagellar M-ring protein FliF [hydrothermal vent metagenome]|uniref:Flagellar M-ring protein FliF n=1 Tax=hydrothermal vent metagenome TaxID=652676 RepID=A0A3B0U710_9ZZZZ
MENVTGVMQRLGLARLAAMVVVAVLLLGFFGFLIFRATSPQLAPLYTGLSFEDSSAIVSQLQSSGTTYELRGEGDTILVPRDQITAIRMNLAADGLPTNGQVGYEIFDNQSTLGATSFVQDVNLIRAMEGELARTISSLARVRTARVHLVLPKRELFRRERVDPTASITLGVRGNLSASEINAIQYLVSSAIQGMSPSQVSIIDDSGRLLAAGNGSEDQGVVASDMYDRSVSLEARLRNELEELVGNIVGAGRVRVQVSAELELNRTTQSTETYDPEGQVVRSTQTRELNNSSVGANDGGAVSIGNELPGATPVNGAGTGASDQSTTTEETVNFEISKSTQTQIFEAGAIKRLSVAVLLDGIYIDDGNGASTYQPRTQEQLAQISALVSSAIGFNAERGDQIEVTNLQFAERADLAAIGTEGPGLFDFTRDDIMSAAEMLVTLLISIALILFVMRPLLKRVLEPEEPLPLADLTADGSAQMSAEMAIDAATGGGGGGAANAGPDIMGDAQSQGEAQTRTLAKVGDLVGEHPKQASVIVRDWLNQAA